MRYQAAPRPGERPAGRPGVDGRLGLEQPRLAAGDLERAAREGDDRQWYGAERSRPREHDKRREKSSPKRSQRNPLQTLITAVPQTKPTVLETTDAARRGPGRHFSRNKISSESPPWARLTGLPEGAVTVYPGLGAKDRRVALCGSVE